MIRRLRGSCRNVDIAERLGRSKPSVTKALSNLAAGRPRPDVRARRAPHRGGRARRVGDARAPPLLRAAAR
ncbi:hypothetical protein [Enorma phocaeensis]|uniref:Winged helix-turn-helix transcriptional regulator n=1 Tax=Enorma phocaeensis TaxID=1871019 RepID=A0ABT7VAV8_9ACTN|nr:hypothetical protein [Enorma phocaeensis]MDM8275633.1 hypothetical protein [Enorma phocaeensis]